MQLIGQNLHNEYAQCDIREDTNFKGSDLSDPSGYSLFCGTNHQNNLPRNFRFLIVSFILVLGLCIPANNTIFIVGISSNLASKEPHLTLEVCTGVLRTT